VTVISGLEAAFAYFGGVPRELLFDQMKAAILDDQRAEGAMLFFQLMSRRYEHAATVLTSNKSFEEWGEIFGDDVMAAALIDRLVHHCHIVNIRGNSYRMRHHAELHRALGSSRAPTPQRGSRSRSKEATAT
jgi:DNA replication protein DnaC